ncbi:MAG TPA: hypothetical protein VJJ48_00640 [Candidatus Paceibacterota bacterium]
MKKFKIVLAISLLLLISSFYLFTSGPREGLPHTNPVDKTISLNRRQNITENAKVSHERFSSLAFAEPDKRSIFSTQVADVVRTVKGVARDLGDREEVREYGTWIWTPVPQMTESYINGIITGAKANKVNVIYVSIDSYLDIYVLSEGAEKKRQEKAFGDKLENFIKLANKKGIEIDAEAGWQNWAEDKHEYKALAILEYVKRFNETREHKFRGFQYDVEPYLLKRFGYFPAAVLTDFVELVDKSESFLGESGIRFSVVIPDFFDDIDGVAPIFRYGARKDSVITHLLDILERREGSSLILMSYRNIAEGADGSIEISQNEFQTAKRGFYGTKIIVAQETGDFPPPYITFHGTSKRYLNSEVTKINKTFDQHANFGGIAIHYVNSFLDLRD